MITKFKIFEKNSKYTPSKEKRFFVDDATEEEETIYIWEFIEYDSFNPNFIDVKLHYKYDTEYKEFRTIDRTIDSLNNTIPLDYLNVLYETNSLEDAYQFLLAFFDSKKYNL